MLRFIVSVLLIVELRIVVGIILSGDFIVKGIVFLLILISFMIREDFFVLCILVLYLCFVIKVVKLRLSGGMMIVICVVVFGV